MLSAMAFRTPGLLPSVVIPLALVAVLFAGPIAMALYSHSLIRRDLSRLMMVRNLVAGPITEELTFRSGLISFLLVRGVSPSHCILFSPLVFAVAHVHHMIDLVRHQGWHPSDAAVACLVQVGYTTVFGWLAAYLMIRTGHFVAVALVHSFCNYMGFPKFGLLLQHPRRVVLIPAFVGGIMAFILGLGPLTKPTLYGYQAGSSFVDQFT